MIIHTCKDDQCETCPYIQGVKYDKCPVCPVDTGVFYKDVSACIFHKSSVFDNWHKCQDEIIITKNVTLFVFCSTVKIIVFVASDLVKHLLIKFANFIDRDYNHAHANFFFFLNLTRENVFQEIGFTIFPFVNRFFTRQEIETR